MKILLNVSTFPSRKWSEEEKKGWNKIIDIFPPKILPEATIKEVENEAILLKQKIMNEIQRNGTEALIWCYYDGDKSLGVELITISNDEIPFASKVLDVQFVDGKKVVKFVSYRLHR